MASINTPDISHFQDVDYEHIYEPAEDSFLMIDAIEKDLEFIYSINPLHCLEIGCGSGVVITACATAIGKTCKFYGVDINAKACRATIRTGVKNAVVIETFCGDLAEAVPSSLYHKIDILIFNPPYVETDMEEVGRGDLEYTWAGGELGRDVIDRFLPQVTMLLSEKGVFYLLLEKRNLPQEIASIMKDKYEFNSSEIITRKAGPEHLTIFKFVRNNL